ncbi:hypothetical protein H0H92_014832 [Tricholoma furcatifolium]|nr:hypothetical protein H0H92_014832 [Tricholoma furcatifolium]
MSTRHVVWLVDHPPNLANFLLVNYLGDDMRYELVRPILERCDAEQLLRLEEASPFLENDTQDIWKNLCLSDFPLAIKRYPIPEEDQPYWKAHYFVCCSTYPNCLYLPSRAQHLKEAEARRLDEASAKLRNQRLVEEERKKEREVKITDRLPPAKRQRTWGSSPAPKTLFQKTRADASKLHKNMYTRMLPPMAPNGKKFAVLPKPPAANIDILPSPEPGTSRVTVNNVVRRRPVSTTQVLSKSGSSTSSVTITSRPHVKSALGAPSQSVSGVEAPTKPSNKLPSHVDSPTPPRPRPSKPLAKKDPMASLFVPKHRAHSQLPS